ncbi:uncharacterized protein LOC108673061 [Hyalella azteca]|uniref:Uncharacterized protein LOC108673061 n=1 Tax=Hyalella azteca TaxID=294128 RepID=A0A979FUK4_HYAAZ|nr:uncharacterized protein LOC108673061 [Hyalella azteca]
MEGVRPRKSQELTSMGAANGSKKYRSSPMVPPPYRLLVMALYVAAGSLTLVIVAVSLNNVWPFKSSSHGAGVLDRLSVMLGVQEEVHAVIIDAGSTGSRVLAFTFFRSIADNSLKLEDQLWHEVKPGLSSYADDPVKGAASLVPLLELAYSRVPALARPHTPLVLKATAGLRLLPDHQAQALLHEVNKLLQSSEFLTTENSVGIMDGRDEGIFSWFTVNYLLDRVGSAPRETLVALDLGGGSTQITFVPADQLTITRAEPHQLSSISLMNQNLDLFTHSYLGLGLMAARKDVLLHDLPNYVPGSDELIRSPCINPTVTTTWDYGGHTYHVTSVLCTTLPRHVSLMHHTTTSRQSYAPHYHVTSVLCTTLPRHVSLMHHTTTSRQSYAPHYHVTSVLCTTLPRHVSLMHHTTTSRQSYAPHYHVTSVLCTTLPRHVSLMHHTTTSRQSYAPHYHVTSVLCTTLPRHVSLMHHTTTSRQSYAPHYHVTSVLCTTLPRHVSLMHHTTTSRQSYAPHYHVTSVLCTTLPRHVSLMHHTTTSRQSYAPHYHVTSVLCTTLPRHVSLMHHTTTSRQSYAPHYHVTSVLCTTLPRHVSLMHHTTTSRQSYAPHYHVTSVLCTTLPRHVSLMHHTTTSRQSYAPHYHVTSVLCTTLPRHVSLMHHTTTSRQSYAPHYHVTSVLCTTLPRHVSLMHHTTTSRQSYAPHYHVTSVLCTTLPRHVTNVPDELREREVIAFSYFFDRATERGLIDPLHGGVVTVNEFAQAARQTCDIPNAEQPFACLDLTFIAAFLHNGYRLKPESPVKLYKKIDGYELSWGLGLAFHVINNGI